MIIITDKTEQKTIYFPRNYYLDENEDSYKLVLTDRGTNKTYEFEVVDLFEATYGFYSFNPDLSNLPNAEYEYSIEENKGDSIIPQSDYDIQYSNYINSEGEILNNTYIDLFKYTLESDYTDYSFYIDAKYRRIPILIPEGKLYIANYMNDSNIIIGKEYVIEPSSSFTDIPLNIPESTKKIYFNTGIPLTLAPTFTLKKKYLKERKRYASGLIRLGSLVVYNNKEYNDPRTYIAYDKQ